MRSLPDPDPASKEDKEIDFFGLKPIGEPIETSLDGSFTLRNVKVPYSSKSAK